jgi:hypothetical protein
VEAKRDNKMPRPQARVHPVSSTPQRPVSSLLGVGDKDYAIATRVVTAFSAGQQAVNKLSGLWQDNHSTALHGHSEIPDLKVRHVCSDICCRKLQDMAGEDTDMLNSVKGLLTNICRSLKTQVAADKKQLLPSARHPILVVRCGDNWKAWLISQPTFKPLTFDCVRLETPECDSMPPTCTFKLGLETAGPFQVLAFESMKKVTAEMLALRSGNPDSGLEYCLVKSYKRLLSTPLTALHVQSAACQWIPLGESDFGGFGDSADDDDDDADHGGEEQGEKEEQEVQAESDEISELVGQLLSSRKDSNGGQDSHSKPKGAKGFSSSNSVLSARCLRLAARVNDNEPT